MQTVWKDPRFQIILGPQELLLCSEELVRLLTHDIEFQNTGF